MLDARVQIRRTRLLMGIAEGTAGVLQRHPQLAGMAHKLATDFVALLAGNFSDSTLTIPKDCSYLAHKRKRGLLKEFNGRNHIDLARKYEDYGVEAVIYTDIGRDGMLSGVNVEATVRLAQALRIPVIASGGIAAMADIDALCAIEEDGVMGAITGRAIYEGTLDFKAAQALADELAARRSAQRTA